MGAKANRRRARKKRQRERQAAEQSAREMRMEATHQAGVLLVDDPSYSEMLDNHDRKRLLDWWNSNGG